MTQRYTMPETSRRLYEAGVQCGGTIRYWDLLSGHADMLYLRTREVRFGRSSSSQAAWPAYDLQDLMVDLQVANDLRIELEIDVGEFRAKLYRKYSDKQERIVGEGAGPTAVEALSLAMLDCLARHSNKRSRE